MHTPAPREADRAEAQEVSLKCAMKKMETRVERGGWSLYMDFQRGILNAEEKQGQLTESTGGISYQRHLAITKKML